MHSKIFQISMEPINEYEYICEDDYYDHWFTNQIADYVSDDCDREVTIKWLSDCLNGCNIDKDQNGYYLVVSNKEEYFKRSFERFIQALGEIGIPTLDDFIKPHGVDLWHLQDAYEDKYGFYVDYASHSGYGMELMTFDYFVRMCQVNTKYYIGGVVDYHF